jgi:putative transcriptional regulator
MIEGEEMDRVEILDNAESLFERAGFYLSQRCCVRPSCFDFVARKEKQLAFVKVHSNIGNVYERDAAGLTTMAKLFSGAPLFVCEKARNKPLEDDTVYSRYNVGAVTLKTLEDTLLKGMGPLIEAGPGGYYVRLDGGAIRKKRLKKGLSVGKLAEIIGVSRRTLYGYERGMAKASVSTAYKLEWVLGMPVVKPIDIFKYPEKTEGLFATAKRIISESRFLQFVIKKLLQFNFSVFQLRRAPFDFVAKAPENKTSLLGAVAHEKDRNFKVRTEEIVSVSKIVDAQPIFVTDSKKVSSDNIPLICREDLEKISCSEDLMAIL